LLVDCGFRSKTDPIPTAGRDYLVGHGSYGGRGGIFWVAEAYGPPVLELGTTIRLDHLPPGTLAYLQTLIAEALPCVEMYCEACDKQGAQVCGVWCEHIWFCPRCQHISAPVERSRKLIGESLRHCAHRFPR
jgi:hypothetical protein